MGRKRFEILRSFRHDPTTGEYFYHLQAKWTVDGAVLAIDRWIPVSKQFYTDLRRLEWREDKREEREERCIINGIRCMKDCSTCDRVRDGRPLSLNQLMSNGYDVEDSFSVEDKAEERELIEALYAAMDNLTEKDYSIAVMYAQGLSERDIAERLSLSQKTVNYRKNKIIFPALREYLKDFF